MRGGDGEEGGWGGEGVEAGGEGLLEGLMMWWVGRGDELCLQFHKAVHPGCITLFRSRQQEHDRGHGARCQRREAVHPLRRVRVVEA